METDARYPKTGVCKLRHFATHKAFGLVSRPSRECYRCYDPERKISSSPKQLFTEIAKNIRTLIFNFPILYLLVAQLNEKQENKETVMSSVVVWMTMSP